MSVEEALTSRLSELESDSFQLKLRNYYLERRVSRQADASSTNEAQLESLLASAPVAPRDASSSGAARSPTRRSRGGGSDRRRRLARSSSETPAS